jgi:hypothetical protein
MHYLFSVYFNNSSITILPTASQHKRMTYTIVPTAVYTEWYLLMMSSKPARYMYRLIIEIN